MRAGGGNTILYLAGLWADLSHFRTETLNPNNQTAMKIPLTESAVKTLIPHVIPLLSLEDRTALARLVLRVADGRADPQKDRIRHEDLGKPTEVLLSHLEYLNLVADLSLGIACPDEDQFTVDGFPPSAILSAPQYPFSDEN